MEELKYQYKYPHPAVTTDCVIFGFDGESLKVLLIERGIEPFKGKWAFPGGFIGMSESAEQCAQRELREETGLSNAYMRQFHTFSNPKRDPRERVITIAYYALVRQQAVRGGDDAAQAAWFSLKDVPKLAFDHKELLKTAYQTLQHQIHFEPVGFELLPEIFTIRQLQNLYEAILGVTFDRRNFYNKMCHLGLLTQVEDANIPHNAFGRTPFYFRFNAANYEKLKQKGFRLEF
ncbi:MAG: NUDIX hydrolase [Bacteroidales bacterium]|nr:NUDIX hydrolase [Bacteroidales bacterium]